MPKTVCSHNTSLEVCRPSDDIYGRVRCSQVFLAWHLPLLGFLSPSAVCSSTVLPALFHAGATHGVQRAVVPDCTTLVSQPTEVGSFTRITREQLLGLFGEPSTPKRPARDTQIGSFSLKLPGSHDHTYAPQPTIHPTVMSDSRRSGLPEGETDAHRKVRADCGRNVPTVCPLGQPSCI